jgi:hypothetical protein
MWVYMLGDIVFFITKLSRSYIDVLLHIDSNGGLMTSLYDKLVDFVFAIVGFPFLCSNMPLLPACSEYNGQDISE